MWGSIFTTDEIFLKEFVLWWRLFMYDSEELYESRISTSDDTKI